MAMNSEFVQTLTFKDNFGTHYKAGIDNFNPFEIVREVHFGQNSCLVGISTKTVMSGKINSIQFWH